MLAELDKDKRHEGVAGSKNLGGASLHDRGIASQLPGMHHQPMMALSNEEAKMGMGGNGADGMI